MTWTNATLPCSLPIHSKVTRNSRPMTPLHPYTRVHLGHLPVDHKRNKTLNYYNYAIVLTCHSLVPGLSLLKKASVKAVK